MKNSMGQVFGLIVVALAGCGDAGGDATATASLVGTWVKTEGASAGIVSAREVVTYRADGTFRSDKTTMETADAALNPGCSTRIGGGGTYVVVGASLNTRGTTLGTGTSGCMRPEDNHDYAEDAVSVSATSTFAISGTRLTLTNTDGVASVYTRQ